MGYSEKAVREFLDLLRNGENGTDAENPVSSENPELTNDLEREFDDDAELVWSLTERFTQEQTARAMGWSRGAVSNYAALKAVDIEAWKIVATSFSTSVANDDDDGVASNATTVANTIFTEGLLRNILDLTADQQAALCDRKGWKALGYESFVEYGERELGYQENYIHKLVNAAEISLQIGFSSDCTIVQPKESQLRPLTQVPDEARREIWIRIKNPLTLPENASGFPTPSSRTMPKVA